MSDQHIHDQGKGFQVEVKGGTVYIGDIEIYPPLPPPSPTGIPSNLPQHPSQSFRGREDDWARLHAALQQTERVAITALHGMGGVGKTELALQYATAKLREGAYPGGVCWLGAREQELGIQITQYFQAQLGLSLPDGLDDLAAQVGYCWRHWREGEVLVVVDDVAYQRVEDYEAKTLPAHRPTLSGAGDDAPKPGSQLLHRAAGGVGGSGGAGGVARLGGSQPHRQPDRRRKTAL
ncbi:hypothetical protein HPC62_16010 [Thermoleptolyngbya sichuanensis A183]|uniref:NB-ARC domain-containing protein n=1 Tax=Thermoleptolyngbya sichuanensis A183 TaxID=2737172 RepID=A0A6M8BBM9_9CYAN|nr:MULTISPECIES: NB-ARC domain-containing protein [Thermoleptolyngbya]QKD83502.1 hypothetical protein HPC62_16010 [Thermoleptolyngbya sichuanensis A183]